MALSKTEDIADESNKNYSQLELTLKWVEDNYQWSDGVCIPRCVLFQQYQDFCGKNYFTSVGPATFGKLIRQKFPKLTTRRLGTRGQSRYHYYGIGIKESSVYYKQVYSGKGLSRFSRAKVKTELTGKRYNVAMNSGTLLPDFPNVDDMINIAVDKDILRTLLMMYRTHCQRILDAIVSANFSEVQQYLLYFWQRLPQHILDITKSEVVADIVAVCDHILYKVINDVLVPSTVQDLPESLSLEMRSYLKNHIGWMHEALVIVPSILKNKKMEVANWFVTSVQRQLTFICLAQTARSMLANSEIVRQMVGDLSIIDLSEIFTQLAALEKFSKTHCNINKIRFYFGVFIRLLEKQTQLEDLMEWLDEIIENCAINNGQGESISYTNNATSEFLLRWSYLAFLLLRELTLRSSASFGSLHLLRLTLDEYLFLVLETHRIQWREEALKNSVLKFLRPGTTLDFKMCTENSHCPNFPVSASEPMEIWQECSGNILNVGFMETTMEVRQDLLGESVRHEGMAGKTQ